MQTNLYKNLYLYTGKYYLLVLWLHSFKNKLIYFVLKVILLNSKSINILLSLKPNQDMSAR